MCEVRGSLNSCLNRHGTATAPGLRRSPQQGCSQLLQDSAEARTPEEASTRPCTSTAAVHWSTACCCRKKDEAGGREDEEAEGEDDQDQLVSAGQPGLALRYFSERTIYKKVPSGHLTYVRTVSARREDPWWKA